MSFFGRIRLLFLSDIEIELEQAPCKHYRIAASCEGRDGVVVTSSDERIWIVFTDEGRRGIASFVQLEDEQGNGMRISRVGAGSIRIHEVYRGRPDESVYILRRGESISRIDIHARTMWMRRLPAGRSLIVRIAEHRSRPAANAA